MSSTGTGAGGDHPLSSVSAPANVLILAPAMSDAIDVCPTVGRGDGRAETLLLVLLHGRLDSRLDVWRRRGGLPETVFVVSCEAARSVSPATTVSSIGTPGSGDGLQVTSIASPGNLAAIGRSMDRCLSGDDGGRIRVCFDSLTTLLQYVDTRVTYQFLHALLPRLGNSDAIAHFHMDPAAHDETTRRIVESLFDVTVRYDEAADEWVTP